MHAPVMRCLLCPGTKPAGMSMPRGIFLSGRRLRDARTAAAGASAHHAQARRNRHYCNRSRNMTRRGGSTAIDGAIALIAIFLVNPIWLLTATLESHLAGHPEG